MTNNTSGILFILKWFQLQRESYITFLIFLRHKHQLKTNDGKSLCLLSNIFLQNQNVNLLKWIIDFGPREQNKKDVKKIHEDIKHNVYT